MSKFTLDTDFATLSTAQTHQWMLDLQDIIETSFENSSNRTSLLANLLVLERYTNTLRQGLAANGEQPSAILQQSQDLLWDWLQERANPHDFEDYANNLYACVCYIATGEELNEQQEAFLHEQLAEYADFSTIETHIIEWSAALLISILAISGARLDFEELASCKNISFFEIEDMLNILTDTCIDLTGIPRASCKAKDWEEAEGKLYQTPLFRQIVANVLEDLRTALAAKPEAFAALRKTYQQCTILPEEFAEDLLAY
ncbi:MAG: hypothetical protein HFG20_11270 [Anaerotruncus sp.]|nr:hypothetical protein [Anaerotruncus sp.]